ncbi:hypothetical protein [Sphingomonas yantingensis]|uniref:Uncharacterized protein n=1 Tax=Sphingomonas yantingensis TaxID=1241761 RepID=A0A7W9AMM9_9SPHN|nr:hypothetical protein [Sphingomonas yantingensis]MBB5697046.1 hypothetical protein [Sphingomonas yantingensis]
MRVLLLGSGRSVLRGAGELLAICVSSLSASPVYSTVDAASDGQQMLPNVQAPPPVTLRAPPVDRTAYRLPGSEWLIGLPADRVTVALAQGLQIKELNSATLQSDGSIEVITDRCYVLIETSRMTADGLNVIEHLAPVVSHVAGLTRDWKALSEAEAEACGVSLQAASGRNRQ